MVFLNTVNRSNALRLSSDFSSSFFKRPSLETPDDQDLETQGDQRISYVNGTISAFENGDDFKSFKKEFTSQINYLIAFTRDNGGDVETVRNGFKTVERRLFNPDNYDYDDKEILYGAGKRALDALSGLLHNEALLMKYRLGSVVRVARDVGACADGAATNLALAANDLNLRLGGNEIYRLKEQVSRQLMFEYIKPRARRKSRQWEIHNVNAMHNALANRLGLPTYEDGLAGPCELTPKEIEGCLSHILKNLTPARLVCAMADECLSQLDTTMQDHFAKSQNGDTSASFSYLESIKALDNAMIPIKEQCGAIGMAGFISTVDGNDARCRIHKDATLIALEILQLLYERKLTKDYLPKQLIGYFGEGVKITIKHHDAQLIWATEDDAPVLLTVKHIEFLFPYDLEGVARLAVAAVFKNSSPARLLESLSSDWLEEADTIQWISKMEGETFLPFLKKHKSAIQKLSDPQRLDIAKHIVACGNVSEFEAYIANNQGLFDASEEVLVATVKFWNVAAENKDINMLDAVANLVLETIPQLRSAPVSFVGAMARGLQKNINMAKSTKGMCVIASFHIVNILTKLCEKGYFKRSELAQLFACNDVAQRPGLSSAMNSGESEKVSFFGNVWLHAASKGVLPSKELFKLLEAAHGDHSALFLALQNENVATITAFGVIVVSAYSMGFLDSEQAAALTPYKKDYPRRRDAIEAYEQILQDIDAIEARSMR